MQRYKIHLVSFENLAHSGSFDTLLIGRGQRPTPEQWRLLAAWVKENETQPVDSGEDLV